jgi:hypothetical protein
MFNKKNNVSILTTKWEPIKRGLKLSTIPRRDEYILIENEYYEVINVIHTLDSSENIFIIVSKISLDNQPTK